MADDDQAGGRRCCPDQAWFWTEEWQAGERKVDEEAAAGDAQVFDNIEDFIADLDREAVEREEAPDNQP